jgi:hypothetical protein
MSDYVKTTNFTAKDTLTTGDPAKVVRGSEIDTEFANIATAIATKADKASPTFTGTVTAGTVSAGAVTVTSLTNSGDYTGTISGGTY